MTASIAKLKAPATVQLIRWIADPYSYLDALSGYYGDTFQIELSSGCFFIFTGNPEVIQAIFSLGYRHLEAGVNNQPIRPLVGDNSLLLLDSDRHQRQRKLLMPPFHGDRVKTYGTLICQVTRHTFSSLEPNQTFIARALAQEITLEVIAQTVFGLKGGERHRQLKVLLAEVLNMVDSPLRSSILFFRFLQVDWGRWSPWGRMQRQMARVREFLQAEIELRRDRISPEDEDILATMLLARDENGEGMSDLEVQDELLTLLIAGHETTATAIAWSLYWVHRQSDVQSALLAELEAVENASDPDAIARLPYLSAVCNETLRIYPIAPIVTPRRVREPLDIAGYHFPVGSILVPCIYLAHHREATYSQSHQFRPDRFLERQYSAAEFLPFGGGNRRCLGYTLALMEMKLVLATILSEFELELVEKKPIKPQRRGVTIVPAGGVEMVFKGKKAALQ